LKMRSLLPRRKLSPKCPMISANAGLNIGSARVNCVLVFENARSTLCFPKKKPTKSMGLQNDGEFDHRTNSVGFKPSFELNSCYNMQVYQKEKQNKNYHHHSGRGSSEKHNSSWILSPRKTKVDTSVYAFLSGTALFISSSSDSETIPETEESSPYQESDMLLSTQRIEQQKEITGNLAESNGEQDSSLPLIDKENKKEMEELLDKQPSLNVPRKSLFALISLGGLVGFFAGK